MKRKLISSIMFCLLIVFTVNQVDARPSYKQGFARSAAESAHPDLWRGLIGAWVPALGVTGNTLFDVSGRGNHGTLVNMNPATDWVIHPKYGYVLDFDGTEEQVDLDKAINLTGNYSLVFSAKTNTDGTDGMICGDDSSTNDFVFLQGGSYLQLSNSSGSQLNLTQLTSFTTFADYVITGNDAIGEWSLYKDGIFIVAGSPSDTDVTFNLTTLGDGHTADLDLAGQIGMFLVYDRVLTQSEAMKLHINPLGMFQLRSLVYKAPAAASARRIISIN